jgi:hypothetical protein
MSPDSSDTRRYRTRDPRSRVALDAYDLILAPVHTEIAKNSWLIVPNMVSAMVLCSFCRMGGYDSLLQNECYGMFESMDMMSHRALQNPSRSRNLRYCNMEH